MNGTKAYLRYSAHVPSRRISFSLLLPVLSLALWVCLISVPTTLVYANFQLSARGAPAVSFSSSLGKVTIPRKRFLRFAVVAATSHLAHVIQAVDLPAIAIELPLSRLSSTWPRTWTPAGMTVESWRAVIYPIYCLPFWWFVGVGLDGLLKRRHLRWPWLLTGTLLCGFLVFLALGLTFGVSAKDHVGMAYVFWGFGFWVALMGIFPATWLRQGLASRRNLRLMARSHT